MSETTEDAEKPAPAKGGKLVTILALVNFLAIVGLGGYLVYTQQYAAAQSKPAKGAATKAGHGPKVDEHGNAIEGGAGHDSDDADEPHHTGPLLPLESMVTNMADPDSDRYLKVSMQVRISSEAAKAEVESHLVPVRNQILLYLSSLTIEETSGADNKRNIQKQVKRIANEAMPSSRITEVYFTEFVIQ